MTRMNRRDYLLQMGVGAVGAMSSAPLNILAESLRSSAPEQNPRPPAVLLWKPTEVFPTNARVTVIFGGLFGFFYKPHPGECEVGAHKGDPGHRLMIAVWEQRLGGSCTLLYSTEKWQKPKLAVLPKPQQKLEIEIVGRSPEVNCYQVGTYNRKVLKEHDFRWLPDLDSDDFYPQNYPKQNGKFKLKTVVRHGTLYTYQRTSSTFTRIDQSDEVNPPEPVDHKDFYHVAEYMAAGIQPKTEEDVSFRIDADMPIVLPKQSGFIYRIAILNHCYKNEHSHTKCDFEPEDPNEQKRNDFHHVRKVLDLPDGEKRYGLKRKGKGASSPTFCHEIQKDVSDEAPCMGSAFGQTKGMPAS